MVVCPWCKATVEVGADSKCPRCGRVARVATQVIAPAQPLVPDLDVPSQRAAAKPGAAGPASRAKTGVGPAPSAAQPGAKAGPPSRANPAAAKSAAKAPVSAPNMSDHGNLDLDDDMLDAASVKLDLDYGVTGKPAPPQGGARPKMASQSGEEEKEKEKDKDGKAIEKKPALDPFEVRALADYGEAPKVWWKTPSYAWRVLKRRPELKKLAAAKRREADRTRLQHEEALVAFAEIIRPQAEKNTLYAVALDGVRATEQVLRERDAVAAQEADQHKLRQAQFDQRVQELDVEVAKIREEEKLVQNELGETETLLRRAEVRTKRAEADIRQALIDAGIDPDAAAPPAAPTVVSPGGSPKGGS
jgi:hypothetical protein